MQYEITEAGAAARGCHGSWLGTFDFLARGCHERPGRVVLAEPPGFPAGHTHYHVRKPLAPTPASSPAPTDR